MADIEAEIAKIKCREAGCWLPLLEINFCLSEAISGENSICGSFGQFL